MERGGNANVKKKQILTYSGFFVPHWLPCSPPACPPAPPGTWTPDSVGEPPRV